MCLSPPGSLSVMGVAAGHASSAPDFDAFRWPMVPDIAPSIAHKFVSDLLMGFLNPSSPLLPIQAYLFRQLFSIADTSRAFS